MEGSGPRRVANRQTDNVTHSKSADNAMNSVRERERERVQALQKFRNLHRVPLREDDLALAVHHDIGAPTDTLSCEAYGVLDSATLPEAVEEPIRSARS